MMSSRPPRQRQPNAAFRQLRGNLSPGEFASAVRRAAREIGEQVSCDARYIGRVESGEIKCPNYAYERVFRHMYPGSSLQDLGFVPRETVRGGRAAARQRTTPRPPSPQSPGSPSAPPASGHLPADGRPAAVRQPAVPERRTAHGAPRPGVRPATAPPYASVSLSVPLSPRRVPGRPSPEQPCRRPSPPAPPSASLPAPPSPPRPGTRGHGTSRCDGHDEHHEEDDVLRRAFMTGGPVAVAAALSLDPPARAAGTPPQSPAPPGSRRVGAAEARAVEQAVRRIRVLDDKHGGDTLYRRAGRSLRAAHLLLDKGTYTPAVADRLHTGAGELAISVGWLAHDCGLLGDARSYYAEALATARMGEDPALEAHAFSNTAFVARDAGRPREAVRAAQAGQQAARRLSSPRLLSLLTLREAGGWAGLGDRGACERALSRAANLFAKGPRDTDPEWMSFYGDAELAGLEAQCWSALGRYDKAAERARLAVALQDPHFTRNIALFTAELADDLAGHGDVAEAADQGCRVLRLLDGVRSSRVRRMVDATARALTGHRRIPEVGRFLAAHRAKQNRDRVPA